MNLKKLVIDEFSSSSAKAQYIPAAHKGLWDSEKHFFSKYFTKKGAKVLDIGCGTGRTTLVLHKQGFKVLGVDLTPAMITWAKDEAKKRKVKIDYRVADAIKLPFKDNSFDYALFSNQGWSQIPNRSERVQSLKEIKRVLKPGGIYIFTIHPRVYVPRWLPFWCWQWTKVRVGKKLGFKIDEVEFGDRFFKRGNDGHAMVTKQFIHIPRVKEIKQLIKEAGLKLREANGKLQISKKDVRKHPPVFFVCQK